MTAVDIEQVVFFDGPRTAGAWGEVLRAFAPYSANGTPLKPCGTIAARQRHYRRGEDPCPACRRAES
jgi:hypothetical protein